jgi:hypothetical protein
MHSRRQVLRWSAVAPFVGAFGSTAAPDLRTLPLWAGLDHLADFVALGRHCENHMTRLRFVSSHELTAELFEKLQISSDSGGPADAAILGQIVSRDFCEGEVQAVDGWRLSTTEVLLAVLAYRAFGTEDRA